VVCLNHGKHDLRQSDRRGLERPGYQGTGKVIGPASCVNVWVRLNVFSFTRRRGGWSYDIDEGGGTGWAHESNVRNFVRLEDVESETRSDLLAGQRDF
jgi:hypothetical protein